MRLVYFLTLAIAFTAPLAAHDMWIEPTSFHPETGNILGVRLRVGQDFLGDPIPRDPALIEQFVSLDSTGRKPLYGRDGADPAGLVRIAEPGLMILGYQSRPKPITLAAATFNQYLKEEGLEAIADLRARRNQSNSEAREVFARCAKSLVLNGSGAETQADRTLGFTLELVAGKNPYFAHAGQEVPFTLTYQGRALPGALVTAMNRANPVAKITARTDENGRVRLRLPQDGIWLIKAVHMIAAPEGSNAEWASFWASLTFELKGAATGVAAR